MNKLEVCKRLFAKEREKYGKRHLTVKIKFVSSKVINVFPKCTANLGAE